MVTSPEPYHPKIALRSCRRRRFDWPLFSGSVNCTVCPGGSSCATPSALPIACSDGEYSPEGASTCTTCPAGSYCPGPPRDEDSKAPCPAGQYSLGGTSSCSACPKGFYCPDASQGPTACPDGYYADVGNMTACNRYARGGNKVSRKMLPVYIGQVSVKHHATNSHQLMVK